MKKLFTIAVVLIYAAHSFAATQTGIIFEVTGANKTSETYNGCPVYAYDGASPNMTIKAYAKQQYYSWTLRDEWGTAIGSAKSYWYLYQKSAKGSKCTATAKSISYNGTSYSYLLTVTLNSSKLTANLSDNQICLKTDNSSGYYTPNIYISKNPLPTYTITFNANGGLIPTDGNMGNTPSGHTTTLSTDQTFGTVVVTKSVGHFNNMSNDCPAREGYTFAGWYTDSTAGEQVYDNTGYRVVGSYWDSEGKWIGTSNVTLYAHWTPLAYTIIFKNADGTTLQTGEVNCGVIPTYTGTTPSKPADAEYIYTFVGWTPAVSAVTSDTIYTAMFSSTKQTYDVQIGAEHGKIMVTSAFPVNSNVTMQADVEATATFDSWSDSNTDMPRTVTTTEEDPKTASFEKLDYTITTQP